MNDIPEDDPVTLAEACSIVFRGKITPATLRAEADRGRIVISRIGKRDFTTLRAARELFDKCRDARSGQGSTLTKAESNGLSETDRVSSALAAARETAARLKSSSPTTSAASIGRNRQARR